ncbi:unnamed protein product [Blepharisma stoltei]|uniref:Uncharacterized protein n=1 Tax=Blepharisma stoltei TaxID=1481888 RepID=A0AAU9JSR4_9CILI|nr:unnamed protein product [Blepharisma stoltei]
MGSCCGRDFKNIDIPIRRKDKFKTGLFIDAETRIQIQKRKIYETKAACAPMLNINASKLYKKRVAKSQIKKQNLYQNDANSTIDSTLSISS